MNQKLRREMPISLHQFGNRRNVIKCLKYGVTYIWYRQIEVRKVQTKIITEFFDLAFKKHI